MSSNYDPNPSAKRTLTRACELAEHLSDQQRAVILGNPDVQRARDEADRHWRNLRDGFLHDSLAGRVWLQSQADVATVAYARAFVRRAEQLREALVDKAEPLSEFERDRQADMRLDYDRGFLDDIEEDS
jgi:hypothetical protein